MQEMMTATHATVRSLTRTVEGVGHKLIMGNFFSYPNLLDYLNKRYINCCGIDKQNCEGLPGCFNNKTLKLKYVSIQAMVRSNLTTMICKDK
jgi:hypothetical protein